MSEPDGQAIVRIDGVSKAFSSGVRRIDALLDVTASLRPGIITGLIGPDGAGKTTLMRLLSGLLLPDHGQLTVLDTNVAQHPLVVQGSIGYMPQRFGLYEDLSVQENLDLYADLQGLPKQQRPNRYAELMHMTGMAPFLGRLAGHLSGGMKQKLGLACTLVRAPRLLLLDEPTVGVDPLSRRELWAIVERLVTEEGMSVLLSTAYLDEAERCEEVLLLHRGRVLGHGAPGTFSTPLRGRTFIAVDRQLTPRRLQSRLHGRDGIVDAVIAAGQVRVVLSSNAATDPPSVLRGLANPPTLEATEPRFEDSFMDLLADSVAAGPGFDTDTHSQGDAVRDGPDPIITVDGLSRRFGDFTAVDNISFSVRRGEVFGLLGANGAGKSTTFRMLCGLLPASSGRLRVAGVDLRRAAAAARARIGYMSQRFSLYASLSVKENLRFFAGSYGLRGRARHERCTWALEQFELSAMAEDTSGELSLGYKQRLAMACALMHEPDILFLDEPTSGVDPLARREFWLRINHLADSGVTVLVTTHFMEEAEYCDRLAIMAAGEILALGTPAQIRDRAALSDTEHSQATMESAFIALIEQHEAEAA